MARRGRSASALTRSGTAYARREASEYERKDAWMRSPDGMRMYKECRAKAQAYADLTGTDAGIELLWNGGHPGLVQWSFFGLPQKHMRFGKETTCEVVHPIDISRTQPGHGYAATRPPSPVGPDYHGGPWPGREEALRQIAAWEHANAHMLPPPAWLVSFRKTLAELAAE